MRLVVLLSLALIFFAPQRADAQRKQSGLEKERAEFAALIREYQQASKEVVASLERLLELHDQDLKRSEEQADKARQLHEAALIGRRELDADREAVAASRKRLEETRGRLHEAKIELAAAMERDPEKIARDIIKQPVKRERTPQGRVYYVRFIIIGEIAIYDYTGAVRGRVVKHRNTVKYDSRK